MIPVIHYIQIKFMTYTLDESGNLIDLSDYVYPSYPYPSYTYDDRGRLISEQIDSQSSVSYTYDRFGVYATEYTKTGVFITYPDGSRYASYDAPPIDEINYYGNGSEHEYGNGSEQETSIRNDIISVSAGSSDKSIIGFGGFGTGANPSAAVLADLDTLQFTGTGLTAKNLQLTQDGANLKITF
jgi:hypothetical protein